MKITLRELVHTLTFIGVVFHEFGHKIFCDITGTRVVETCYFRFGNPAGYVIHEKPKKFLFSFLIVVGPFISGLFFAVLFYWLSKSPSIETWTKFLFIWLGVSTAMHSFPSSTDARALWKDTNKSILKNPLVIIGYPFVLLIRVVNGLTVIWIDLIYAILLWYFVTKPF